MAYVGRGPDYGGYEKQTLTADGSTTTFTLDFSVGSAASLMVSVGGVYQEPEVAYNLGGGGTTIVFSAAPASGLTTFVVFLGFSYDSQMVLSGAITAQTALTTGVEGADTLLIYDNSSTSLKKLTLSNTITAQTDLTTGLQGADELLIYDNSATGTKKVNLDNLIIGQTELATTAADDDVLLIYDLSATEIKKIQKSNIATTLTYVTRSATGDGSTTTATVTTGATVDDVLVFLNGICQKPTTDYTISGTTLTFTTAPASGNAIVIRELP